MSSVSMVVDPPSVTSSSALTFHGGFFRFELGKENDALLLYEQDSNFRQEDELSNSNLTLREESSRYVDFTKVRGAYLITRDCRKSWLLTQLISPTGHNSMIAGGPLHHGEKGWECLFRTQTRRENLEEYCNQESPQSISGFQGYFSSWLAGIKLHKVRMQPGLDEIAMTGWKSLKQRLSFKGLGSCCGSTSWISRGAGMNLAMALAAERDLGDSNVKTLMSLIEETDGFVQEKCGLIEGAVLSATVPFSTSLISSSNQQRQRRFFQCLVFGFKPRFELHHLLHLFKELCSKL
ncbi:hypothetical protein POTOM_047186 [Populus tomentosa]|uniref:Uncharacterized protein n=1 Tax=Populus tomentosa TaxID=118781 RepID=A0A8X7YHE3_POPTO|nr:hypothetical protein POTOM_047186 [Populus tomentosa]